MITGEGMRWELPKIFPASNLDQWRETLRRSNVKAQELADISVPDMQEVLSGVRFLTSDGKHWIEIEFEPDGVLRAIKVSFL